jgi:hypothetical protein
VSSSPPGRLWSPAPAAALLLLSSGWAEARTSSTDKVDLYLLISLSSPARGPTAAVSDRRTVGLSDHRVPESDSGSAHWHTAAAMTVRSVPQCGMGRGLTTDERAGTDSLSEAWLALHKLPQCSHRDGPTPAAAAAADAVPTQTVGPGPCGPVAAGCYGASAAAVHSQSLRT